jgi:signal peptide peptidase-like 2B
MMMMLMVNFFVSGTLIALGWKRGELRNLWVRGEPERVCTHVQLQLQGGITTNKHDDE